MTGENAQKIPAADSSTQVQQSDSRRTLHPGDESRARNSQHWRRHLPAVRGKGPHRRRALSELRWQRQGRQGDRRRLKVQRAEAKSRDTGPRHNSVQSPPR
jgi:hypothetical protein